VYDEVISVPYGYLVRCTADLEEGIVFIYFSSFSYEKTLIFA
jgi:hypothetical protein